MARNDIQYTKLRRIFNRKRNTQNIFHKEAPKKGYRYLIMELPYDEMKRLSVSREPLISTDKKFKTIKVRAYNPNDPNEPKLLSELFNLILLTSPDPYRPLTEEETRKYFGEGTFIAFLYGKPVGYGVVTIEETEEGKIGVIAGIGVHPRHRRKKIALFITIKIGKWFLQRNDLIKLQCEVFEDNKVSQAFISSLGFKIVGEMYLD